MIKDNLKKTKSFLIPIVSLVVISVVLIAFLISYININMFKNHMYELIEKSKKEYFEKNRNDIYRRVHMANDSIKFQIAQNEKKLKKYLTERVEIALDTAQFVYNKQKGKISDNEIRKIVIEHLNAIKFKDNKGFYFISDYKTNRVIEHGIKKIIKKDMTNFKDSKGNHVVSLRNKAVENNKIGFLKVYNNKPNDLQNEYPKLNAVALFKPLNIVIGTGRYLDVIEKEVKNIILDRYSKMQKNKRKYTFFIDLHNINGGDSFGTLIFHPNKSNLIGKKLNEDYKDAKGNMPRKKFLKELREKGESYAMHWIKTPNTKKVKQEVVYFYLNKNWNWILGGGFFFEDLEKEISEMEQNITQHTKNTISKTIFWVILLSLIAIIIAIFVSIRIDKTIKRYTNELIEQKDKEKKQDIVIAGQEKMVQMGEMIGNIAHQWRQPLSVISTASTGMKMQKEFGVLTDEDFIYSCNAINDNAQFLSNTIDTFRDYIKEKKELKEVVLQDRINNAINIVKASLHNNHIELINNINDTKPIKIAMVVGELSQVIINLINNAKDILLDSKINNPSVKVDLIKKDNLVIITIEDNGGGIDKDILPKIFDPYFTTKHASQGTGLGLHMSKNIVEKHLKGKLYAKNKNGGAIFTIELPV